MPDPSSETRVNPWRQATIRLAGEAVRLVQLRRELAELEIRHDLQTVRRLATVGGIGAVLALVGLPLLVSSAADGLRMRYPEWSLAVWNLVLATPLVVVGVVVLLSAIRRFRREFRGLENTLAELREDAVWLREWVDSGEQ